MPTPKMSTEIKTMFSKGNVTWYNTLYTDLKPIHLKPNQFNTYQQLSECLIQALPKQKKIQNWKNIARNERHARVKAIRDTFKKRFNSKTFYPLKHAYGWKVFESNTYEKWVKSGNIENKNTQSKIATFLENGDVTIVHKNQAVPPFYLAPKAYKAGSSLKSLSKLLYDNLIVHNIIEKTRTYTTDNLYKGFSKLFRKNTSKYLGYYIISGKINHQQPKESCETNQGLQFENNNEHPVNFDKLENLIFPILDNFYKTFMTNFQAKWFSYFNNIKKEISTNDFSKQPFKTELESYSQFSGKSDCMNYLKTSNSFYHRVVYWFLENPIDSAWIQNNNIYCENHHIFPLYLKNNNVVGQQSNSNFNKPFNIIRIPWFIHFLFHAIRFVEFQYKQDFNAICIMRDKLIYSINNSKFKPKTDTDNFFDLYENPLNTIFTGLTTWVRDQNLQKTLFNDQQMREKSIKQLKPQIKNLYANSMIWQNEYFKLPDLLINGKQVELHIDLVFILDSHFNEYVSNQDYESKYYFDQELSSRGKAVSIQKYLNQIDEPILKHPHAFFGFTLQAFQEKAEKSLIEKQINQSRAYSRQAVLDLIDKGGFVWINKKYNDKLTVKALHYKAFPYLIYDLIVRLPDTDRPKSWNGQVFGNKNTQEKFAAIVKMKTQEYFGWTLKKIEE